MYRLMWVSEAVKSFQDQYSPHTSTRHYELFIKVRHAELISGLPRDVQNEVLLKVKTCYWTRTYTRARTHAHSQQECVLPRASQNNRRAQSL